MDHRHPGVHLIVLVALLVGCRCADPPPTAPQPTDPPHFDEWDRLVRAAAMGQVETAQIVARDLTDDREEHEAGSRIGGALGYLQLATEPADLADGVVPAAAGCGSCHVVHEATPPELPPWTHETAAARAVATLVWDAPQGPPPGGDEVLQRVAEAWTVDDHEDRVTHVLLACQGCHAD